MSAPVYDKWFLHEAGEWTQYIAVDSSQVIWMAGDRKFGFDHAIGIMATKMRGEPRVSLPCVHTDLTFANNLPIVEIAPEEVPSDIRSRLAKIVRKGV